MFDVFIRRWTMPDNPSGAPDCFIVLSYAVKDRVTPVLPTRTIIHLAKRWQRKFPRAKIIMSTGDNQGVGVTNAHVMAEYGVKIGIPRTAIIEEGASRTTYENMIFSEKIMRKRKLRHPILVLYDLHVRRALAVARALGWKDIRWVSAPSAGEAAYGIKSFQTCSRLTIFLYELLAFVYNRIRGQV